MGCYYCAQERIETDHRGTCSHCKVAVCTAPSSRFDGEFHAERCECGCGRLVCEKDILKHARECSGEDGSQCFPALWIGISGGGLHGGAAVRMDACASNDGPWHQMTRFLNAVRPGHEALRPLTRELPGVAREFAEWGRADEPKLVFAPEFFNEGVVETVMAHAADAIGRAGAKLRLHPGRIKPLAEALGLSPMRVGVALGGLAHWHRDGTPLEASSLEPWMPDGSPREVAARLARTLNNRRPQSDDPDMLLRELVMEYRAHGPAEVGGAWGWL
ncbi:MAG TPA: hypothetical protein VNP72_04375, partial [Longimicrobium sp.]|nr:hypothetical protein [Longimicrobium sp.]